MKKALTIIGIVLLATTAVSAEDLEGEMFVNGYVGYALGFGDAFEDYETDFFEFSVSPTFNLGGQFFYGMKENIMIGGELYFQNISAESEDKTSGVSVSDSEFDANILANGLYAFNHTEEKATFGIAGLGLYDGDLGLSAGIIYQQKVGESIMLFGMPRFHLLFTDPSGYMLQLSVGASFPIGG